MEDIFGNLNNEDISWITHFVFLHVILTRSQMLLIFSGHQMMHNISYVALCDEVTYEGYLVIQ